MLSKSYFTAAIFGYFLTESSISVSSSQVTTTITNVRRLPSSVRNSFVVPSITGVSPSDYEVSVESISLTDVDTGIEDIKAVHNGRPFDVIAKLHWEEQIFDVNSTNALVWEMSIGGVVEDVGTINLNEVSDICYVCILCLHSLFHNTEDTDYTLSFVLISILRTVLFLLKLMLGNLLLTNQESTTFKLGLNWTLSLKGIVETMKVLPPGQVLYHLSLSSCLPLQLIW